ncbi:MAG: hypothetical protein F6K30_09470 [Cyanothece sp. SIO2G6]|nr:hypothetical protein [Cyanothece sp. SIO2G6]
MQGIKGGVKPNGTDLRLVGSAHPTVCQYFQRSQFAYVSAIGVKPDLEQYSFSGAKSQLTNGFV